MTDLHTHTAESDGSDTPAELLLAAHQAGKIRSPERRAGNGGLVEDGMAEHGVLFSYTQLAWEEDAFFFENENPRAASRRARSPASEC